MEFQSDKIDEACRSLKGHTNWAYYHTLTDEEKKKALQDETTIVFYRKPEVSHEA